MPGKKRTRWEGELDPTEEEELHKRNKGGDMVQIENGDTPGRRPSSRASEKSRGVPSCKNGHELILVSKEVRRLEKEIPWSCDYQNCKHSWDSDLDTYMDRQRFRCVHHTSGNSGCNFDLCGDCYLAVKDGEEPRRSSREIKPKFKSGHEGEWVISPKFQTKTSPDKHSPKSGYSENNMVNGDSNATSKSPPMSPRTRHTRSQQQRSRSPPTAAGRSPRARSRGEDKDPDTESDFEESRHTKIREESPFYPTGVRFSPSVKNGGSPYGRRTRSGGRSRNMTSYLQSLASEDEQNEFNRQYSRDLRKRQARKLSEESQEEKRSTRLRSGDRKSEDFSAEKGGRRVRVDLDRFDEEGGDQHDTTRTPSTRGRRRRDNMDQFDEDIEEELSSRRSLRSRHSEEMLSDRSRRRHNRPVSVSEDDRPLASRRRRNQDSNVEVDADHTDDERRLSSRRPNLRSNEAEHSEDEAQLPPRRRRNLRQKVLDHSDDEDEGDPTVTEASVRRSSRRRARPQVGVDAEDADTESGAEKQDEEEETEETEDSGDGARGKSGAQGQRRSSRRNRNPVDRFSYEAPPQEIIRGRRSTTLENLDKYATDEEFNGGASPKKKKYSLRTVRANTNRYQAEINGDVSTKDRGLIRRTAMSESTNGRSRRPRERKQSRRTRTGDSSSPTSSSCSDQEAFERRKSKRMLIEREKLRPLNMSTKDVTKSIFKERSKIGASLADVQPMEMDSGVTFNSIGGLKDYVNALKEMVMFPLLYPELFDQFKIMPPRGVLFYGPPGTGKTLLARALANECSSENRKVAFFMRKGADCLSKWIGESERQLRLLFDQAYQMRPSIIFFDEIDGLAPVRSSRQDQIHSSIVSTLLALMDGLDNRGEIIVIGATNRIENIDPALRRPGRFDRELRFSLPCKSTRKEILKLHTKEWNPPVSDPLMNFLSAKTLGYCGADIKGLCAEAALNALRRRYPQVYESSQKLQIDLQQIEVVRQDFDKALRKIVPATHRVEDKVLSPLPRHIKPLLEATHQNLVSNIKRMFPHSAVGKGAVLPKTLTHRPRLMIVGSEGQGQNTYVGPALLHFLEKFPCQKLDIPALFSNSARTPEEACTQIIHSARRTMPGVLYIPHLCMLWDTISDTVRATLITLLLDIPPTAPLLILALCNRPYASLAPDVQSMFLPFYREIYKLENPSENERREYFRPLFVSSTTLPPKPKATPQPVEPLPVLPAPETRKLTQREEKRLRRKEEALLRELRIFLRDIWAKINRESKFFMFRSPVNTEEVDDYLEYVKKPMDFEKMHQKLDDGEYQCAQDFLDDIDLIAANATAYNCDLAYETNRIICHRARALQDFAYALVKAEMDTDFEDECKTIVERRDKLTKKLKKMDKEKEVEVQASPSKMQELMAIVELACKVCNKTSDDSNMLICDGCDEGYHTYCMVPCIDKVPDGDWFCPKCVEIGVDKLNETGTEPGSAEIAPSGSGGTLKKRNKRRHRRSKWSSGVLNKPRSVKKKILDSGDELQAEKKEDEKDDEKEENEGDNVEDGQDDEKDEDDKRGSMDVDQHSNKDDEDLDKMLTSPRSSRSALQKTKAKVDSEKISDISSKPDNDESQTSITESAATPDSKDTASEETANEEKCLKVDMVKLGQLHEQLVSVTENFPVELLERTYASLAKIVRNYRTVYDRSNLTAELEDKIKEISQAENTEDMNVSNTSSRRSPRK